MNGQIDIFGNIEQSNEVADKIEHAKEVLRVAAKMSLLYYHAPLIVTYSGGKDSDVLLHLAETTLKPDEFEVMNNHTTVDAPQTVKHIKENFARLKGNGIKATVQYATYKDGSRITMWNLIERHGTPPTRLIRYCCDALKEQATPNRIIATGVRGSESLKRQGRDNFGTISKKVEGWQYYSLDKVKEVFSSSEELRKQTGADPNAPDVYDCKLIELAKKNNSIVANPIYEWDDDDVWNYIKTNHIKTNPLYEMGYKRVGCIGCPMATYKARMKEFADFPKYQRNYIRAFDRMLERRKQLGKVNKWATGQEVFDWWVQNPNIKGQMSIDDIIESEGDNE